jgi:hypothetical protein
MVLGGGGRLSAFNDASTEVFSMKRFLFLLALIGAFSLATTASAGPFSGLWVGTATLKYVSEVNKQYSDLSFDLGLVGVKAHDALISEGDSWDYNDSGDPAAGVQNSGSAPLGYGQPDVVTSLTTQLTIYFSKNFQVSDPTAYSNLRIRVWRDDGVVLYLNGQEIFRNNMPTGSIDFNTLALSEIGNDTLIEFTLPATLLQAGDNLLAAEVHQADGSPDLLFDLELTATLKEQPATELIAMETDAWKYDDTDTDLGNSWKDPDPSKYDDSAWSSGTAPFSPQNQTTIFFRKSFTPVDQSLYSGLHVRVWRDDGVVLYLNGQEILRNNLPSGSLGYDTLALSEIEDDTLVEFSLPATLLQDGQNLLAAEVHEADGSTDLLFDLELTATIEEQPDRELITMGAAGWMYNDSGMDPATFWRESSYDDLGWPISQGQFGYGENDEQTTVSESAPTVYFRREFSGQGAGFTHLRILLLRDDGAVIYVNGTEILRSNMPPGTITHTTAPVKALGSADEGRYIVVDAEVPPLNAGNNVVAVELHQHPAEMGGSTGTAVGALTRTSAPLDLRLLLHVDGGDRVRLLKEVIQVYDSSARAYVLLTDHTLVPNYTGVAIRDGVPVGRRLSAVGFDFQGTHLACTGGVSQSGSVDCSITLGSGHPTNPFLHRYHPDHDNLDERYENPVVEAFTVTRTITLNFTNRFPSDEDLPERSVTPAGWGGTLLGGYYTETLTGIHKDDITLHGPFILRKVADTETLTP